MNSMIEQKLQIDVTSTRATAKWSFFGDNENSMTYKLILMGDSGSREFVTKETSYKFDVEPGKYYVLTVWMINKYKHVQGLPAAKPFKTIFCREELCKLEKLANKFGIFRSSQLHVKPKVVITHFRRVKLQEYWDNLQKSSPNRILPQVYNFVGHPANAINNESRLKGILFCVHTMKGDSKSSMGDTRLNLKISKIIKDPEQFNVYFCDFYCIGNHQKTYPSAHYVDLIVARRGSVADRYGKKNGKHLNIYDNSYFSAEKVNGEWEFSTSSPIYVNILLTKIIHTKPADFDKVYNMGSRNFRDGRSHNPDCTLCNLNLQPTKDKKIIISK